MYTTLLWATDGSPEADGALATARELLSPGGRMIAFHCDQHLMSGRNIGASVAADEAERLRHIEHQVHDLQADGVDAKLFVETTSRIAPNEIAHAAQRVGAEAIVCGTRGIRGLRGFLNGSVAAELLRRATVPIIVVPSQSAERASSRLRAAR